MIHYKQQAENSNVFTLIISNFNDIIAGTYSKPFIIDLDHDGLLDLLIGESAGILSHYEQIFPDSCGFQNISDTFNGFDIGASAAPLVADVDSNGLLDLIIGNYINLILYEQDHVKVGIFN
ncbi:MAG: hypothetical protein R2764_03775 [Bacteroidales bacterium]